MTKRTKIIIAIVIVIILIAVGYYFQRKTAQAAYNLGYEDGMKLGMIGGEQFGLNEIQKYI